MVLVYHVMVRFGIVLKYTHTHNPIHMKRILGAMLLFISLGAGAQTALVAGDLAFTHYNSDNGCCTADSFAVVVLTNIDAATQVRFTDIGWYIISGFGATGEDEFLWTSGAAINSGTVVHFWNNSGTPMSSVGSCSGSGLQLASTGDQVIAFQGTLASPTSFIAGIHMNVGSSWNGTNWDNGSTTGTNTSDLPTGLTNGVTALTFSVEVDNGYFDCATYGFSAANCNDQTKWVTDQLNTVSPCSPAATNTTWNGTWSNGAPTASLDAIIASNAAPGNFSCKNLTINNGLALTVSAGTTTTISGDVNNSGNGFAGTGTISFTNNSTSALAGNAYSFEGVVEVAGTTVLNTNNLLTLTASSTSSYGQISGTGTVNGNVTVQKVMANTNAGWRQFALPVDALVTALTGVDVLTSAHATATERNIYYWDPTNVGSNVAAGWTAANNTTDDEGKAYIIYSNNANVGFHELASTISITGVPNQSSYTHNLQYTYDPAGNKISATQRGWNFIPNKFPSNLDVTALINDANFGSTYKAIHVYDQVNGQYVGVNQSTMNSYNNSGTSVFGVAHDVQPFQGFWVKATSTSQSIQVKTTHRITDISATRAYMKRSLNCLIVDVADASGRGDRMSVIFDADATAYGLDGTMDIFKLKSRDVSVPTLFAVQDSLELSVNALPQLSGSRTVELAFESQKDGETYTYKPDFSSFDPFVSVLLEDKKTASLVDLRTVAYSFVHDKTYGANRFVLHFSKASIGTEELKKAQVYAFVNDQGVEVQLGALQGAVVELYALSGQLIDRKEAQSGQVLFPLQQKGAYLLTVRSGDFSKSIKVIR
jgi:hypothetical protein